MGVRHRPYAPTLRGIIIKRAVSASLAVLRAAAMPLGIEAEAQRHEGRIAARRGAGLQPLVRASAQVRRRAARSLSDREASLRSPSVRDGFLR
jgi:hypothetical protein